MENLLPDYAMWRRKYTKAALVIYFLLIVMEVAIFFVLKMNNMILQTLPVYLKTYFFTPIAWYTAIIVCAFIGDRFIMDEKIKNALSVIAVTGIFGVVAIIHNVFSITMFLFFIPIMMTIVFGDRILLWIVTSISGFFVIGVVVYTYVEGLTGSTDPYFIPSVIIALVGIGVCGGIANTLIELLNTQNRRLISAVEAADQANKSKSAFLSNMSHEIRTPMNAIVGITDIMLRTKREPADEKYLLNIKHSGSALLSIINDILDFSKIESGKMELVEDTYSIKSMLDDLSLILWNRIGSKDLELIYDIDPKLPDNLYGDALRVRQVIINLANNAVKFTESGFVKVSINVNNVSGDDIELKVAVSDSGQGIKKEDLSKLFMSFEQINTKKNHKKEGTGLGLAISKQLITMMGGEITVESEYGKGTTFAFNIHQKLDNSVAAPDYSALVDTLSGKVAVKVSGELLNSTVLNTLSNIGIAVCDSADKAEVVLTDVKSFENVGRAGTETKNLVLVNPYNDNFDSSKATTIIKPIMPQSLLEVFNHANAQAEGVEAETDKAEDEVTFDGAKILLVEDNEINTEVALMLFEPLNMEIDVAENGQIACDMVKNKKYDLVFMDHMMPVMDGVEATKMIRSFEGDYYRDLPIIALTANAISEAKAELTAAGMNDVTVKPISMAHIIELLQRYL